MKNLSLKFIVIVAFVASTFVSCKKLDGPVPDTKVLLSAKTWTATSATRNGVPISVTGCGDGLVLQLASSGLAYLGSGPVATCGAPGAAGTWTLDGQILTIGTTFVLNVSSVSATNMSATITSDAVYAVEFSGE